MNRPGRGEVLTAGPIVRPRPVWGRSDVTLAVLGLSEDAFTLYNEIQDLRDSDASKEEIVAVATKLEDVVNRFERLAVTVDEQTGEIVGQTGVPRR